MDKNTELTKRFGKISVKKFIEAKSVLRKSLENIFSKNGYKLISERIIIPREKIISILDYLPHDFESYDDYGDYELIVAVCLLQCWKNPFITSRFLNKHEEENLVPTYELNKNVYLESYIDTSIPHPKLYDVTKDACYIIYQKRKTSEDEALFKSVIYPN